MDDITLILQVTPWLRVGTVAEGWRQRKTARMRQGVSSCQTPRLKKSLIHRTLLTAIFIQTQRSSTSTQHRAAPPLVLTKDSVSADLNAPKTETAPGNLFVAKTRTATNAQVTNTARGNSSVPMTRPANALVMKTAPGNSSVAKTSAAMSKAVRCVVTSMVKWGVGKVLWILTLTHR